MSWGSRFGFEWKKYNKIEPYYKEYKSQFLNWIYPLTPDFFKGKKVLDAGCGMGRNSYWCLEWGAREVTAFDIDERSVDAARENLKNFKNATIVLADICDMPWTLEFDFVFSIGVIHHLKEPLKAIAQIKNALKEGGKLLIWVYGLEGFETYVKILNFFRKNVTSKIEPKLLHKLTYFLSLPLYVYIKIFNHTKPYFNQLKQYRFSHIHSILFDQFIPEISNYYTRDEAFNLLHGFRDVEVIKPPNENGWIVTGIK